MRVPRPIAKDRRKVRVPDKLRDSLREVHELIQLARHDPDINLDYDDAIQVGAVCGGRYGKKPRPFVLTYYPTGDADRGQWFLTLHRTEIEDISDGRMEEILLYCCTSPECRCKFREADEHCFYCDCADDPDFGEFDFPEAASKLALRGVTDLSENSTRDEVIKLLGPPAKTGGGTKEPGIGYIWPWIDYSRADCQIRFEFNKTGSRTRSVTISDKKCIL